MGTTTPNKIVEKEKKMKDRTERRELFVVAVAGIINDCEAQGSIPGVFNTLDDALGHFNLSRSDVTEEVTRDGRTR